MMPPEDLALLENRISAATRAAAATVADGSAPPLRLPAGGRPPHQQRARRRTGWNARPSLWRIAAPVAAAAAVLAVIATSVAVSDRSHAPSPSPAAAAIPGVPRYYLELVQRTGAGPGTLTDSSPAPTVSESSSVPPIGNTSTAPSTVSGSTAPSIGNTSTAPSTVSGSSAPVNFVGGAWLGTGRDSAVIRDTASGATLATAVAPEPAGTFIAVTGAADDRTFVLAAEPVARHTGVLRGSIEFFRATFDPGARSLTLAPLPIPEIPAATGIDGLALSPDGARLAVAISSAGTQYIRVYSTATGSVRVWRQHADGGYLLTASNAISFASNGLLAFNWGSAPQPGVWLLDTHLGSGGLINDSRFVLAKGHGDWQFSDGAILTSNGTAIIATLARRFTLSSTPSGLDRTTSEIAEFSAASGRELRVRWPGNSQARAGLSAGNVIWSNPSGSTVLLAGPNPVLGNSALGVLRGTTFTALPRPAPLPEYAPGTNGIAV